MGSSSSAELHQADVMVRGLDVSSIHEHAAPTEHGPNSDPDPNSDPRYLINWPGFDMIILACIGINCVCMAMQDPTLDEVDQVTQPAVVPKTAPQS